MVIPITGLAVVPIPIEAVNAAATGFVFSTINASHGLDPSYMEYQVPLQYFYYLHIQRVLHYQQRYQYRL